MRTEQLERESEYYSGERECYVHMERTEGSDLKVITNGGATGLSLAGFVLIQHIAEECNVTPEKLMRFYKKRLKELGRTEHSAAGG